MMNPKYLVPAALAASLVLAIYFSAAVDEPAKTEPVVAGDVPAGAADQPETELEFRIDAAVVEQAEERDRVFRDERETFLANYPVIDQEFLNSKFVLPRNIATADDPCVPIEMPVGDTRCWEDFGFDPYLQYDLDVLISTAADDPKASAVLSLMYRADEPEKSLFYALQASHLTGKPGPLYRYTQHIRRVGDIEGTLDMYAIAMYAESMNFQIPISGQYRYWLRSQGLTDEEIRQRMVGRQIVATLDNDR